MMKRGILVPVTVSTKWSSNCVVVEKPNKIRICLDPQRLNQAIRRSVCPIPTVEEILPSLRKAKVFSIFDALDGFTQIPLDEDSSFLATMQTPLGRYRWLRMPHGISSAPEEYQRRQHEVLECLNGIENVADDILVFGCGDADEEAEADHDHCVLELLQRCWEKQLKLNRRKMQFKVKSVKFMGHLLTREGLRADPDKITAVTEMLEPKDKQGVQRYVGMVNCLSKFCPHLSDVIKPLRDCVTKEFVWSRAQMEAFTKSKVFSRQCSSTAVLRPGNSSCAAS